MEGENQHFVPKAYLKHFCYDGKAHLFQSKHIKYKDKWEKARRRHINSICYHEDIYDLNPDFAKSETISPDFVERNAFWYEKGFMDELLERINNEKVRKEDLEKLPDFYLSMTARNPVFLSGFEASKIQKTLDSEISKLKKHSEWVKKMAKLKSSEEVDNFFLILKDRILKEHTQHNMYSKSLFNQHRGNSDTFNEIRNRISKFKIVIGKIKEDNQFFITNDFPGFSICENGYLNALKFKGDISHYITLSSKVIITLLHPEHAFDEPDIKIGFVSKEYLDFINDGTIKTSQKYIFCENEDFLNKLVNNINGK